MPSIRRTSRASTDDTASSWSPSDVIMSLLVVVAAENSLYSSGNKSAADACALKVPTSVTSFNAAAAAAAAASGSPLRLGFLLLNM